MPNAPLDYAVPARRSTQRGMAVILLVLAVGSVALVGWKLWGDSIRARYQEWTRLRANAGQLARCATYSRPADEVVYEEAPAAARGMLSQGDCSEIDVRATTHTNSLTPADFPFRWQRPVVRTPALWREYGNRVLIFKNPHSVALLFMHERTSPNGARRLVCIGADCEARQGFYSQFESPGEWGMVRTVRGWVHEPDPAYKPDDYLFSQSDLSIVSDNLRDDITFSEGFEKGIAPPFPLRFFAGQPDPNDASGFAIRYQLDGIAREGVLTGKLNDAGGIDFSVDFGEIVSGDWHIPTTHPVDNKPLQTR